MPSQTVQNPDGTFTIHDEYGNTTVLRNADELKAYKEKQGMTASAIKSMDLDVACRDELHPVQPGPIETGDLVFVRAAKQFGEVQRKVGDAFRVCMRGSGRIETRWGLELERRA